MASWKQNQLITKKDAVHIFSIKFTDIAFIPKC